MIVHENAGEIDVTSFTTFGVNAKPNAASPIGYFGTGLKYACAVLVAAGCEVTVWIGEEPHVFFSKQQDFRGKEFHRLYMRRRRGATARWMATELPFTTELGKNWKLWMALRELHSNALDEGGRTYGVEPQDDDGTGWSGVKGSTRIVVQGEQYAEAFRKLDEIFLPDADPRPTGEVQALRRPSLHGYYRGLRAYDLSRKSVLTWNVTSSMNLTEDRTLQHGFMFDYYVTTYVMGWADRDLVQIVLRADAETFEGRLDFNRDNVTVSPQFIEMARLYPKNKSVTYVVERHDRKVAAERRAPGADWRRQLSAALTAREDEQVNQLVSANRAGLALILDADVKARSLVDYGEEPLETGDVEF